MGRSQDRLPALAAELVALGPDLLVAGNPQSAIALKSATSIPLVFVSDSAIARNVLQ
jgi:putative ABC transport system substrate-binding protein